LHLEVIQHRLERDFKLGVKVHRPRVSYRETVKNAVEARGECHRLINGVQHTAAVRLKVELFDNATQNVVVSIAPGHGLPPEFLDVVLEELENAGAGGGLLGFPLMRLKATVLGGQIGEAGLSEIAFRTAANQAFDTALREGKPVLLEPIMRLEINTPDDHVGDLVSDLQQRRAIIHRTETRGMNTVIHAEAPLANLFGYSSAMRSLSQGRASATMEPANYASAPPDVLQRFLGDA
jgi:elongation factor G